jgi:hypothetical protein
VIKTISRGTCNDYSSTLGKREQWGDGGPIEELHSKEIRQLLDWVHERAVAADGTNPGRTASKARDHLRAVLSWAGKQELIDTPPRLLNRPWRCGPAAKSSAISEIPPDNAASSSSQ